MGIDVVRLLVLFVLFGVLFVSLRRLDLPICVFMHGLARVIYVRCCIGIDLTVGDTTIVNILPLFAVIVALYYGGGSRTLRR